MLYLISIRPG